jgi:hypothetical protein
MPIELSFRDKSVREICECSSVAERVLGSQAARRLRARLSDIRAAQKISEVVAGSAKVAPRGHITFVLQRPHKLVLEPAMKTKNKSGEIDWDAIDSFCVIQVD